MGLSNSRQNNDFKVLEFQFMPKKYIQGKTPLNISKLDEEYSLIKEKSQGKKIELKQEEDILISRNDFETEIDTETVIQEIDQRNQAPSQYPFSAVGLLIAYFPTISQKKVLLSSATIIGPKYIITAAHSVYISKYGGMSQKAYFRIGQMYTYRVVKIDIPKKYKELTAGQRARYDYAILTLKEDTLERDFGSLGLCSCWEDYHTHMNVTIVGYPSDLNLNSGVSYIKYSEEKQIFGIDEQYALKYKFSTSKGSSGGPLIIKISGRYYVIGIHVQGFKDKRDYNSGVLFDEPFRKQINEWIVRENRLLKIQNNFDEESQNIISEKKVNYLIANNNQLRQIPQNLDQVQQASCNLDIIIVLGNKINKILNLQNCLWLKSLNLSNNHISKIQNLQKLTYLQKLKLYNNKITRIEGLNSLKSLLKLNLNGNEIEMIQNLSELKQLLVLALQGNKIKIVQGLENNKEIKHLLLSRNQIITIQINNLLCLPKLKTLRIHFNPLSLDANILRNQTFKVYGID